MTKALTPEPSPQLQVTLVLLEAASLLLEVLITFVFLALLHSHPSLM